MLEFIIIFGLTLAIITIFSVVFVEIFLYTQRIAHDRKIWNRGICKCGHTFKKIQGKGALQALNYGWEFYSCHKCFNIIYLEFITVSEINNNMDSILQHYSKKVKLVDILDMRYDL